MSLQEVPAALWELAICRQHFRSGPVPCESLEVYGPRGTQVPGVAWGQVSTRKGSHWSTSLLQWDQNARVVGGNLEEH